MGVGTIDDKWAGIREEIAQMRLDIDALDETDAEAVAEMERRTLELQSRIDGFAAVKLQQLRDADLNGLADKFEKIIMEAI